MVDFMMVIFGITKQQLLKVGNLIGEGNLPINWRFMNTNIKIILSDTQRNHIKNLLDGKTSSRLATRQDVSSLVEMFINQLTETGLTAPKEIVQEAIEKIEGYKFYSDGQEISQDKWLDIPCDDCGCLVSVSESVVTGDM